MRVLISGAGIAGSTLAWFLAKAGGTHITILEKSATLLPHGQNVDITGSAITVIKKMGLLEKIKQFNTTEKGTRLIDTNGKEYALFPVKKGSTASFSSEFEILRADLAKILYEATKDHPNVTYLFDTTIKQVISNDNDSVKVELSNGETHKYDFLSAADGQWSKTRKQNFPPENITVVDKGMYVVYWTIPRLPIDNDWWNVYCALESKVITLRPDPYGTIRAMFTCMPCSEEQAKEWVDASKSGKQVQQELLRKEFKDAGWQAQRLLDSMDEAPDFYFQVIQQIKMTQWYNNRIVCVGDAGYAPSPLTGQGTSMALMGAYILAGELGKLKDGENPSLAFKEYDNAFRPYVEKTQDIPFFVPGILHPRVAWKRWLLQSFVSVLAKVVAIPWLSNKFPDAEGNNDGFLLPPYPSLPDASEK